MIKKIIQLSVFLIAFFGFVGIGFSQLIHAEPVQAAGPSWDKSSLFFDKEFGCQGGDCQTKIITAKVCNSGQPMTQTSTYEVYYIVSGNPKNGAVVSSGTINTLGTDECQTLSYDTNFVAGVYMFKAYQLQGHPGIGQLWSNECSVNVCVQTSPSPQPSVDPSPSASPQPNPSPSASPTATVSPVPQPSVDPAPSSTPQPSRSCQTSLANDNLQCTSTNFDAVFDVKDADGKWVKDVKVTFSFNGQTQTANTNENGRAKVNFGRANGTVTANPDNGCPGQSMTITAPVCEDPATPVRHKTSGQVLGASTLADTGRESDYIGLLMATAGTVITLISAYGYAKITKA